MLPTSDLRREQEAVQRARAAAAAWSLEALSAIKRSDIRNGQAYIWPVRRERGRHCLGKMIGHSVKIRIAALHALFRDPRLEPLTDKEDPTVRNYPFCLVLAIGMIALGSCSKAPPLTAADDQRIDKAMEQVKAEQDRTDQVERQKRTMEADVQQKRLLDTAPNIEAQGHPVQPDNLGQHSAPDIQINPSSGITTADTSRLGD